MYNPANSSAVHSDRLKESKKLADDNALLRIENEHLKLHNQGLKEEQQKIIEKSGFLPDDYRKIEKEHIHRMEKIENQTVEKRVELNKIAELVADKKKFLGELTPRVFEMEKKFETLKSDIKILEERKENAEKSTKEATTKYDVLITAKSKELSFLTDESNKIKNANITMNQEMEKRLASVVEQERQLSVRRTDMEIYEARLRRKYPNEPIILS